MVGSPINHPPIDAVGGAGGAEVRQTTSVFDAAQQQRGSI